MEGWCSGGVATPPLRYSVCGVESEEKTQRYAAPDSLVNLKLKTFQPKTQQPQPHNNFARRMKRDIKPAAIDKTAVLW